MSIFVRVRQSLVVLLIGFGIVALGCQGGAEGDRCNPDLSHNDCNAGLTCQQPLPCVENYCCPTPASSSSNPYCQGAPSVCPSTDATTAVADAAASSDAEDAASTLDSSLGVDSSPEVDAASDASAAADTSTVDAASTTDATSAADVATETSTPADAGDASSGD